MLMHAAILAGANYIWHSAGWLEAGLTCGYSKFATDCEQLVGWYKYAGGLPFDDFKEAMAAIREVGPQGHFLGTQHTLEHFESAFFMPTHHGLQFVRAVEGRRRKGPRHPRPRESAQHARGL